MGPYDALVQDVVVMLLTLVPCKQKYARLWGTFGRTLMPTLEVSGYNLS